MEWKETRFKGLFANDEGEIRGLRGETLKGYVNPKGYRTTSYKIGDKIHCVRYHVVICEAFHGPKPSDKHHAAHRDGNKLNNRPDNLYWATPKENENDKRTHGRLPVGEHASGAKLTQNQVDDIRSLYRGDVGSQRQLAERFGVSQRTIHLIVTRKTWR